jgi:hypothetical protein
VSRPTSDKEQQHKEQTKNRKVFVLQDEFSCVSRRLRDSESRVSKQSLANVTYIRSALLRGERRLDNSLSYVKQVYTTILTQATNRCKLAVAIAIRNGQQRCCDLLGTTRHLDSLPSNSTKKYGIHFGAPLSTTHPAPTFKVPLLQCS